MIYLKLKISI
jgi:hypothetical protein